MEKAPKLPTIRQLMARFPDDASCLEHLFRTRWGARHVCRKCDREARYYRVKSRRSYECEHCGNQVYPTAGTPFHATRTSLKDWFFVMFLFCASRNGVSAMEVMRQIGVTYKTAWRMCSEIRKYMGYVDGDFPLGGTGAAVEIDETLIGAPDKRGQSDKMAVFGMMERGGDVVTRVVPDRSRATVRPIIEQFIPKGTRIMSDEWGAYTPLRYWGYQHETVNHSKKEWTKGDAHTNSIEGFWSALKRGINGTYIHVSQKHLQKYLWEFEFRHNLRKTPHLMMDLLLLSFPRPAAPLPPEAARIVA